MYFSQFKEFCSLVFFAFIVFSASAQQTKKPNIILILADDMGYSDLSCYGGEVQTPNINSLATEGLKFKQFYNAARCCPTRASLMTGLYPHQAGMGWMAAADLGTPEYQGNLNNTSVTIAEVMKSVGYSTYMTGKWHLTNERKIAGKVMDNWPKQRGFDRYFGIIPGGANYYTPELYSNNKTYPAPANFYLTDAISDTTVKYISEHEATKKNDPFFMYVAYTAPHWPLHALQKDIDKYKNAYKVGWDEIRKTRFAKQKELGMFPANAVMSDRDSEIPAWSEIPENKKNDMAKRMAIYAAQIDVMDQGIGRIIKELKTTNQLDNTLIFFLSDNGACAEFISSGDSKEVDGGADTFESYRINWANVSSTPFKEYKHYTYEGGIATPLIVHWPNGIKKNLNNSWVGDYGHIIDIMATCIDVGGAKYPATFKGNKITPLQGKSLLHNFNGEAKGRGAVFWEHEANIALRDGKWKLVAKTDQDQDFNIANLRLYDMEQDPIELNDLSAKYPERVNEMYNRWHNWGEEVKVFPMDTREYNVRMADYKRELNGDFNDNLGGWNLKKSNAVTADVKIDNSGKLNGQKSLMIAMQKPGQKPADLSLNWGFKADKGEKFQIDLTAIAKGNSKFYLRLEDAGKGAEKMIDQEVKVNKTSQKNGFTSIVIPKDGNYRLSLYFGDMQAGEQIWIDQIKLIPIKKS
ncbi:sulfatase [Pedobacter psychrophilus]|uniref:Sulfatase n=1 Tax=Pedobacter psychrophilus TaxID=1826909 RepID=A0A179DHS6_9SPHI|nr:arylsulfatase [Pedobacter psychrophilus]OAQ40352.1 sulfatase [Pedobacter psychrophilus]